ncbi:MAG: c-type cytochrome [Deltaproteobacteria bacterium]|nr:c-type cytochrome [Deltaproteobacteria bacterium]
MRAVLVALLLLAPAVLVRPGLAQDVEPQPNSGEQELGRVAREAKEKIFTGDAEMGWELFREKNCMRCHAVWGEGGEVGPDLGRTRAFGHVTAGQLAATMWNHVPRMWEKMEEGGIRLIPISPEEMSHLFAFLLFIRYADEPGDPVEGKSLLAKHKCDTCHSIDAQGGTVGPDLAKWTRFVNPVVWAQKMWKHATEMKERMASMGIAWPQFSGQDLNNIVAYIRSRTAGEAKEYIEPGSAARGEKLFEARGCGSCHTMGGAPGVGPDLLRTELANSLSGIATRMWNHAPKMQQEIRRRNLTAVDLTAQEMADITTYLLTRRYFLSEGDPDAGRKVFFSKQCVMCHAIHDTAGGRTGPNLGPIKGNASPILMAHVMWRYGPAMLSQMAERGVRWPHLDGQEMADLIAFINRESLRKTPP